MPDATSPDDALAELEKQLTENQKTADRLKAEIADQKKIAGDVDQKEKDFTKAADDLAKQKKVFDDFVVREKKMLEATVDKNAIQALKKAALDELKGLADKVTDAANAVQAAEKALADAKAATASKQADFDKLAGVPAANAAILKDAASLLDKANNEGKANNFSRMYFLVLVLEDRLKQLDLTAPDDYTKALNQAAADLTAAGNAERAAKTALDAANAALKEAQKNFDAKKASWRDDALKQIPAGNGASAQARAAAPPPPPPAAGGSEAAQPDLNEPRVNP